jgi:hypothetical protein
MCLRRAPEKYITICLNDTDHSLRNVDVDEHENEERRLLECEWTAINTDGQANCFPVCMFICYTCLFIDRRGNTIVRFLVYR